MESWRKVQTLNISLFNKIQLIFSQKSETETLKKDLDLKNNSTKWPLSDLNYFNSKKKCIVQSAILQNTLSKETPIVHFNEDTKIINIKENVFKVKNELRCQSGSSLMY